MHDCMTSPLMREPKPKTFNEKVDEGEDIKLGVSGRMPFAKSISKEHVKRVGPASECEYCDYESHPEGEDSEKLGGRGTRVE